MKRGYTQLWLILAVVLTLGSVAWVIAELAPMGIRGEWVWSFEKTANVDRVMFALVPVAVLGWLTWGMGGSLSLLRRGRLWAYLVAVIMLTVWLQGAFAYMSQNAFAEATFWMGTPKLNEDFDEATRMTSIRRLLQEVQNPELTIRVHETSHLPGPILFYHLQWRAWRNMPSVATWFANKMESTLWYSRDARVSLEMDTLHREFFPAERATLYSSMVLLWLAVALGVVPLYYWMNDLFGQGAAITAVGLYPVIPGLLIFNPVTDQLFVPMALLLIGLFHWGLSCRKPIVLLLAGMAAWVAFQFTLLLAAILVVILIDLLIDLSFGRRDKASLIILAWPVAGFFGCYVLAWLWLGYNSFNAWAVWVTGAADYIETHHRSYGWWLLYNPVDFALFLGAPLAVFAVRGVLVLRENWTHQAMWRFMVAFLITILVLNLTGVTRGEVARVWLFLMPLATALAAYGVDEASDHGLPFYPVCLGLLFLQATVFRMSITGLLSAVESIPY